MREEEHSSMQRGPNNDSSVAGRVRALGVFVMHQIISVLVVGMGGIAIVGVAFDVLADLGWSQPLNSAHWVLTGIPFFPVQGTIGFALGWGLGRWLHHRSMLWVWVAPLLLFLFWKLTSYDGLPAGVQMAVRIGATGPLFAAGGYSLGALLAQWGHPRDSRHRVEGQEA